MVYVFKCRTLHFYRFSNFRLHLHRLAALAPFCQCRVRSACVVAWVFFLLLRRHRVKNFFSVGFYFYFFIFFFCIFCRRVVGYVGTLENSSPIAFYSRPKSTPVHNMRFETLK